MKCVSVTRRGFEVGLARTETQSLRAVRPDLKREPNQRFLTLTGPLLGNGEVVYCESLIIN